MIKWWDDGSTYGHECDNLVSFVLVSRALRPVITLTIGLYHVLVSPFVMKVGSPNVKTPQT